MSIVLLVLLAFSLLGNFGLSLALGGLGSGLNHSFKNSSTRVAGPRLDEFILEDNGGRTKIAVISVDGIIASIRPLPQATTLWM